MSYKANETLNELLHVEKAFPVLWPCTDHSRTLTLRKGWNSLSFHRQHFILLQNNCGVSFCKMTFLMFSARSAEHQKREHSGIGMDSASCSYLELGWCWTFAHFGLCRKTWGCSNHFNVTLQRILTWRPVQKNWTCGWQAEASINVVIQKNKYELFNGKMIIPLIAGQLETIVAWAVTILSKES